MKIVQLLSFKLKTIESIIPNISAQGFDTIQINPMQAFKENNPYVWYFSYQPLNFKVGNVFGTKEELKSLCQKAKEYGIDIVVDVVINHVANFNGKDIGRLVAHPSVDPNILLHPNYFKEKSELVGKEFESKELSVKKLIGLPGLKLNNTEVQKIIFDYLTELKECGVSGIRIDAAKHIGLPSDGNNFFIKLQEFLLNNNMFSYAEFININNMLWIDEMAKYSYVLTNLESKMTNINKKVAFIESHDTYLHSDGCTRNISDEMIKNYYYLLSKAYNNILFYVRAKKYPFDEVRDEEYDSYYQDYNKLNELDFFDQTFLTSNVVKKANNSVGDKRLALALERRT